MSLEDTFLSWTKPPSTTEETRCNNSVYMITNAIKSDPILSKINIQVFAQGSYANNTNVRLNSDVDVCVCNMDCFFPDYPAGKAREDFGHVVPDYSFTQFKNHVGLALRNYFGDSQVTRGDKTFDIRSTTYRVEADAVPCYEHRRYSDVDGSDKYKYKSGIEFISDTGEEIISWPKQHLSNGIKKNNRTGTQFKKGVRIFRKLNLEMQKKGITISDNISGYLLECLCWNTDDEIFTLPTYEDTVKEFLKHINTSTQKFETVEEWGEINELKYLFRKSQKWNLDDVRVWTVEAAKYLGYI